MVKLISWLFPVTLFSFMAGSIHYLSALFDDKTRLGFLLLLTAQALFAPQRTRREWLAFGAIYLYLVWCVTTSYWSAVIDLSFAKSLACCLVVFSFVMVGKNWALRQKEGALDFLGPISLAGLAAAGLGYFFSPYAYDGYLFQGFVHGANMLGWLLAIGLPWFLWRAYIHRRVPRWRFAWGIAPGLVMLFILMSQSRSALLLALCTIGGLLLALSKRKLLIYIYAMTLLVLLVVWFRPDALQSVVRQTVYKQSNQGLLYSREQPWADSWAAAQAGGWLGAGYGVSIGDQSWSGGLSSVGYGREKGNSQLAIVEETGVVGLGLYFFILPVLGGRIFKAFKRATTPELKVSLGLVLGAWTGMHLQSVFEAWWVAPGSPEFAAFWGLTGVALGLSALVERQPGGICHPAATPEVRHV